MSGMDWIPGVSQLKSVVQAVTGDTKDAVHIKAISTPISSAILNATSMSKGPEVSSAIPNYFGGQITARDTGEYK